MSVNDNPSAYQWPDWASNVGRAGTINGGFGWGLEINGNFMVTGLWGRVSLNSLPELHHLALVIDAWDAEVKAQRQKKFHDEVLRSESREE